MAPLGFVPTCKPRCSCISPTTMTVPILICFYPGYLFLWRLYCIVVVTAFYSTQIFIC